VFDNVLVVVARVCPVAADVEKHLTRVHGHQPPTTASLCCV
jgi:D-mannonate dehydratase